MARIKLRNLGQVGYITDVPRESLTPQAFTEVENVTFREGVPQKAMGYLGDVFGAMTFTPLGVLAAQGALDYTWIVMSDTKVYAYYNGALIDITRVSGDYTGGQYDVWTGVWVNGVSVINNQRDVPQFVGTIDNNAKLADLTNWPVNTRCKVLRNFKNYFFAMYITKDFGQGGQTEYPTLIKWSHPADPGNIPPSWDETDPAYLAGEFPLSMTPGELIDGLQLKNAFMLYKSDAVIAMRETGDNDIFRFDPISLKFGIPAPNCVAEVQPGVHVFWNQHGDIMLNNGQTIRSIATGKIKRRLQELLNFGLFSRSFIVTDVRNTEVLFCFPRIDSEYCDYAITWNWEENTFGERELPPSIQAMEGKYDLVLDGSPQWDANDTPWDEETRTWDGVTPNLTANRIISVSPDNQDAYIWSQGYTADGTNMRSMLERRSLPIAGQDSAGNLTLDPSSIKLITRVWPLISASRGGEFEISIGVQDSAVGSTTWQGPFPFNPDVDRYVDVLLEGKYISYRIVSRGEEPWQLDGIDFEIDLNGELF
mgnify:CR=1 FL=1